MSRISSPVSRRYAMRMAVLMVAYLVLLFGANYLFKHGPRPEGLVAYVVAIAPALPMIGAIWAVMQLIVEETDEFLRMLHVRQSLIATGFCLSVVSIWEFLQQFDLVGPGNGGFGAVLFWFVGLGLGAFYNKVTLGTTGSCA